MSDTSSPRTKALVAVAILALGTAGTLAIRYSGEKVPTTLDDAGPPAPPIVVAEAREVRLRETVRLAGRVAARRSVDLAPEVAGRLVEVGAEVGDRLAGGAVAFRLDDRDARLRVEDRRARLAAAEARALQARRTAERRERLGGEGVSAPESVEEADLAARVAGADLEIARQELALAERALEKSGVAAPWPGIVVARHADPGAWLVPGQAVLRLLDLERLDVRVDLPASDAVHLLPGDPARVRFAALPGDTFEGRLRFVAAEADDSDLQFPAAVELAGDPRLAADLVAEVELDVGRAGQGVAVPLEALRHEADGTSFVWRLEGEVLRRHPVVLAASRGGEAILRLGLEPGDRVLVAGPAGIVDGMAVGTVSVAPRRRSR